MSSGCDATALLTGHSAIGAAVRVLPPPTDLLGNRFGNARAPGAPPRQRWSLPPPRWPPTTGQAGRSVHGARPTVSLCGLARLAPMGRLQPWDLVQRLTPDGRGRTVLAAEPRRMPPRVVHDHRGDDAAAAVFADLCRAARRLGSRRDRAMVGRRLWRDVLCRRAGRAAVGTPRRPLRPQADADPGEPRHGGRHVVDRHGPQCVGACGLAPVRRLCRRLCVRLDHPGSDANAEGALRMGARHADIGHHGRQSGRPADRRRAAAA